MREWKCQGQVVVHMQNQVMIVHLLPDCIDLGHGEP